ncbi:MAG: methylenetetrahydrofolate reductase, partial [Desulfobacterales bacterium]|nr:methylenetetrahydrofolate reductase [Desulfobacterales bacterium]
MLRVFQNDIVDPDHFVITLELVPGRESQGRSVDLVTGIARDAFADGRVSAVSITDNPGGNPSLSPDVLGHEIYKIGMDAIVHFTCRDANRVGMESRGLQLAMMGMKNILALTGDYSGQGFGGQGLPVFDLDSVNLQIMLGALNRRLEESGDPDGFFTGCAVSPFKYTEAECFAQYAKLKRKVTAGAQYIITQLGYDARKFQELLFCMRHAGIQLPVLGSVYLLSPMSARIMNAGKVPGATVSAKLLKRVLAEWRDKQTGREMAIERAARLGAVLKGLGYRGIHIGGIHRDFTTVARILNRLEEIEDNWRDFVPDFDSPDPGVFYAYKEHMGLNREEPQFGQQPPTLSIGEKLHYNFLKTTHRAFFDFESSLAPLYKQICVQLDGSKMGALFARLLEDPVKYLLLRCRHCGDCGIQHVGFLCPESGCPKHTRNGACGGSREGHCEVNPERYCVWYRAHNRLASGGAQDEMYTGCVPPRMWELNETSSWINFHIGRDHQSASNQIMDFCRLKGCGEE